MTPRRHCGTSVGSSGLFPSDRNRPVDSLMTGKPADVKPRVIRSFSCCCCCCCCCCCLPLFCLYVSYIHPSACLSHSCPNIRLSVRPPVTFMSPYMSVYTSVFHSSVRPPGCLSHSRSCPYVYVSSLFRLYLSYGRPSVCLYVTFVSHACLSVHRRRLP